MNNEEIAKIKLLIDGDDGDVTLKKLQASAAEVNRELRKMKEAGEEGSEGWKELKLLQDQLKTGIKEFTSAIDVNNASMLELNTRSRQLNAELKDMKTGSEEWIAKMGQIAEVDAKIIQVREEMARLKREAIENSDAYKELQKRQEEVNEEMKAMVRNIDLNDASMNQLTAKSRLLGEELKDLKTGSAEWIAKMKEIGEVDDKIAKVGDEMDALRTHTEKNTPVLERLKDGLTTFAAIQLDNLVDQVIDFGKESIKSAAETEDAMADISKAMDITIEAAYELNEGLKKIDTRTPVEELQKMTVSAGQFGVAKEDVLAFVESTDKLNIALGDQFSSTEELSTTVLRLRNIFSDIKSDKIGDDMLFIGNAMNALEGAGSASASVMADFSSRMGGVLIPLGMTTPQILGLSASLEEMNVTAERGSTAVTAIVQKMLTDIGSFAKVAGMSTKDFSQLVETDLLGALMKFAEGSKRGGDSAIGFANILKDTSLTGSGASEVLSKLASGQALVKEKVDLANVVIKEQSSVLEEYEKKNNNAAAELAKMGKEVTELSVDLGQVLLPYVIKGGQAMLAFVDAIRAAPEFVNENKTAIVLLGSAVLTLNANQIRLQATTLALAAADKAKALAFALSMAATQAKNAATVTNTVSEETAAVVSNKLTLQERIAAAQKTITTGLTNAQTIATNAWTIAQTSLNAVLSANPVGAVIAVLAVLAAGIVTAYKNSETFRGIVNGVWEALKVGVGFVGDLWNALTGFLSRALEPLAQKLAPVGALFSDLWTVLKGGVKLWLDIQSAILSFADQALGGLSSRIAPVRTALSSLWSTISDGAQKIKSVGSAVADFLHIDTVVSKAKEAASKMGTAFKDAYNKEMNAGRDEDAKADAAHNTQKTKNATTSAKDSATAGTTANKGANDTKSTQNSEHLSKEEEKARKHEQKVADDKKKANADALKSIEEMKIALISNELQREVAKENLKLNNEKAAVQASVASAQNKLTQIELLEKTHQLKIDQLKDDARKKQEQLLDRWLDDDYTKKIKKAQQFGNDEIAIAKATFGDTAAEKEKLAAIIKKIEASTAAEIKKIRDEGAADEEAARQKKEKAESDARQKKLTAEKDLFDNEFKAAVASSDAKLVLAKSNADLIYQAKLEKLTAEYEHTKKTLENIAAAEKEKNQTRIKDVGERAEAEKTIDATLKTALKAEDVKFEAEKKALHRDALDARKKDIGDFFSAVQSLMQGDFVKFTQYLLDKLTNAKKATSDENADWKEKAAARLEMAAAVVQGLQALNQAYLQSQLAKIQAEKTARIAAVNEQISTIQAAEESYQARKAALEQQLMTARTEAERQELRQKLANLDTEQMGRDAFFKQADERQRQYEKDMADLEKKMLDARTEAEKKELQDKIDNLKAEQKANETTLQNIAKSELQYQKEKKELEDKLRNARTDAEKKELQQKLTNLEIEKKGTVGSKKDMEDQIAKINAEAAAKEKEEKIKAWKRDQALQISMAVINAAAAALKSLATMGWPLGLVGVAASAVAAGIQIAMIKGQRPPEFRKGGKGYVKNAGVVRGDSHGSKYGEAGISMINRMTGEEVGEMEGNEPFMILSRNTYSNNKGVVDRLLHSSLHQNGAPIFRDGGTYGDYVNLAPTRKKSYREGGYEEQVNDPGTTSGGSYFSDADFGDMSGVESDPSVQNAATDTTLTTEEIKKSQALMENIEKNTEHTALVLDDMYEFFSGPFLDTLKRQNDALALDVRTKLTELIAAQQSGNEYLVTSIKNQLGQIIANGGTANGLLGTIASKDLSVQTFVNVFNNISVVAGDSNLR